LESWSRGALILDKETDGRGWKRRSLCNVYHGSFDFLEKIDGRFYTTYRLLPAIKESVVVIGSPGYGAFYDETDPGFEKPENRKKMTIIRQGRRDCLYLDSIFKVSASLSIMQNAHNCRNSLSETQILHFIISFQG
jgi:hypothetical protein